MRRALLPSALALIALTGLAPASAGADVGWVVGSDFRVGGAYFSLGFYRPAVPHYDYGHQPTYYYRARAPLRYAGVQCTTACYLQDGYYHHHPTCPVVSHHLRRYDYHPSRVWASIGVPYGHYGYRPPAYGYRPPPRPYYRYDHRWDDHRGRGHGHDRGRGHGHHKHGPHCGHH